MRIIAKVGEALQQLFGKIAEETAGGVGVIVRKRKFTAQSLAQTFVLGFLRNPRASHEERRRSPWKLVSRSLLKPSSSALRRNWLRS